MLSEAITERTRVVPPHGTGSSSQLPFSPARAASFCFGTSECKNTLRWFHFLEKRAQRKLHCWASSATPIAVITNWQLVQLAEREGEERSCDSKGQGTCQKEVKTLTWYLQTQILACMAEARFMGHRVLVRGGCRLHASAAPHSQREDSRASPFKPLTTDFRREYLKISL